MTEQEDIDRVRVEATAWANMARDISDIKKEQAAIKETTVVWRSRMTKAGLAVLGLALSQTQPGSDLIVTMVGIFTGVGK